MKHSTYTILLPLRCSENPLEMETTREGENCH